MSNHKPFSEEELLIIEASHARDCPSLWNAGLDCDCNNLDRRLVAEIRRHRAEIDKLWACINRAEREKDHYKRIVRRSKERSIR